MFQLLATLAPVLRSPVIAAVAAAGGMWLLMAGYDAAIDDPAVRRVATAECKARVARVAAAAELAERQRQQDAARAAAAQINKAERERDAAETELANQTEVQIAKYREQLAALGGGGGCNLGPADLDFLQRH